MERNYCNIKDLNIYISDGNYSEKYPRSNEFVSSGVPFIRANNIVNDTISDEDLYYISEEKHKELLKGHVKSGDILLTTRGNIGEVAIVPSRHNDSNINAQIVLLRIGDNTIDNQYLLYALQSENVKRQFASLQTGTALKQLPIGRLLQVKLRIAEISEQIKIADRIHKCKELIFKRKQQLQKLDELVKTLFVEMFGDPISNPKGWCMPLIEDIVAKEKNALKAGPFGSALKKEYYTDSGYKIYGQEQVINGDHKFGDYYIDTERYRLLENCAVKAGDVLISLVGTYGKSYVMPEEFEPGIINPRLMKITFDKEKINPYYFQHYFQSNSLKKALAENTHGGTMDILNLSIVRKLTVPLPPLELQNEFIALVNQIDKLKLHVQKSLEKLETLKKALMQKYFG